MGLPRADDLTVGLTRADDLTVGLSLVDCLSVSLPRAAAAPLARDLGAGGDMDFEGDPDSGVPPRTTFRLGTDWAGDLPMEVGGLFRLPVGPANGLSRRLCHTFKY